MLDTWEKIIDPNFISAELIGAPGAERTVTITDIDFKECYDQKLNSKVKKQTLFFQESLPMVLNKTNAKMLMRIFGQNPKACVGRKITLYVVPVKVGGKPTTGIRIKEYAETRCESCGSIIQPVANKTVSELVEISRRNTGKTLCLPCMKKAKEQMEKEASDGKQNGAAGKTDA